MSLNEKFAAIRRGCSFLILKIVAADKVYVADILSVERHRVRHAGRHAVSAAQQDAPGRARRLRVAGVRRRASAQVLRAHAKGKSQLAELNDYWKHLNATIAQIGR